MWVFYVLAIIPVAVGAGLWALGKDIIWWEWLLGSVLAFVMAGTFHILAIAYMTHDVETWSGKILTATHYPEWVEEYTEVVTHGSGKNSYTTTETRHRTHDEYWDSETTLGTYSIDDSLFSDICHNFNNCTTETPSKSGFYSGDKHIYVSYNNTGYVYPITTLKSWTNRVQASPSLFSFPPVPKSIKVFDYPRNSNWLQSNRLLGTAAQYFGVLELDRLNTRLGPAKKINIIIVGFPAGSDPMLGQYQQDKWANGKKNDLVICYSGGDQTHPAEWSFVFGWSESEFAKQNLQTFFLRNPINNKLLDMIDAEVMANYQIKNWHKMDYISVEPPTWSYWVYVFVMIISQTGFYIWARFETECLNENNYSSYQPRHYAYRG